MKKDRVMLKRYLGMVLGVFIISIGIALFKESHLGNDPISALNMRLAEIFGISLGLQNLYANIIFLIVQILFGRKYIGAGTFVNGVLVGYVVSFFYGLLAKNFGLAEEQGLFIQIVWAGIAVVVTSLGVSLYQTADLGIAPYDYLSLGLREKALFCLQNVYRRTLCFGNLSYGRSCRNRDSSFRILLGTDSTFL